MFFLHHHYPCQPSYPPGPRSQSAWCPESPGETGWWRDSPPQSIFHMCQRLQLPQGGGRKFPFTPRVKSKAGVRGKVLGKLGPHLGQGCPQQNLGIVILNPSLTPSSNPPERPPGCSSKIHLRSSSLHTIAQPGSSHSPLLSCPVQPPWGSLPQACSLSLPVYPTSSAEGSFRNRNPITGPQPKTFRNLSPHLGRILTPQLGP